MPGTPQARHLYSGGTYKGNVEGSDPRYSFHWTGKSDRLYVFEAPVDMLSFITLRPKNWMNHSYVTWTGVGHAMLRQLEFHPNLQKVISAWTMTRRASKPMGDSGTFWQNEDIRIPKSCNPSGRTGMRT
jgi:hypothetical protein